MLTFPGEGENSCMLIFQESWLLRLLVISTELHPYFINICVYLFFFQCPLALFALPSFYFLLQSHIPYCYTSVHISSTCLVHVCILQLSFFTPGDLSGVNTSRIFKEKSYKTAISNHLYQWALPDFSGAHGLASYGCFSMDPHQGQSC